MPLIIMLPAIGKQPITLPLFGHKVEAGFPSPADDYIEGRLLVYTKRGETIRAISLRRASKAERKFYEAATK